MAFFGRQYELGLLNHLLSKQSASLVVITGRRRIGKSRLVEEFAKGHACYSFSGIPPHAQTSAFSEQATFFKQLVKQFGSVNFAGDDWWDMLWFLAEKTKHGRVVILFDEITWMASKDPDFLGKLKTVWDTCFKKNKKLILVLCGSVSIWIQKHILSATGFVGRVSLQLVLKELSIDACDAFFLSRSSQLSAYDKFKFLSVCGGVPRYLEEFQLDATVEENINRMCFHASGILFNEFNQIFYDSIDSQASIYKNIVELLVQGALSRSAIAEALGRTPSGDLSEYLKHLVTAGFVSRDYTWHLKRKITAKSSVYRLSDNYMRFYLKYIAPKRDLIQVNQYHAGVLSEMVGWSAMVGLQFENLVLNNRKWIQKALEIAPGTVEVDNPYFQKKTSKFKGCQVDYLIQTKTNVLYVCEVKFSRHPIKSDVLAEMQAKIASLHIPRGFSCLPVLIHVNGAHDAVLDAGYFFKVIDFSELFSSTAS